MLAMYLTFSDDSARLEHLPAHRQMLTDHASAGNLMAAGPFGDESGALVLWAGSRADLDAAVDADPYYSAAGVEIAWVKEWTLVAGDLG